MKVKEFSQSQLTGECWSVQLLGRGHCNKYEFKGKKDCGGKNIIKTGKNEHGFKVPIVKEVGDGSNEGGKA